MPRITPVDPAEATGETQDLFQQAEATMGTVPNVLRTMGNAPAVLKAYLQFSAAMGESSLNRAQREMLSLRISQHNRCGYCVSAHSAIANQLQLDDHAIERARKGEAEDSTTRAMLAFADALVERKGFVEDRDLEDARTQGLDDQQILEITAMVALNTLTNYVNHVAETDIDFPQAAEV